MDDISEIVGFDPQPGTTKAWRRTHRGEHCSGLVRVVPDFSDVFFSHDSWSDFRDLHGQLKEYHLPIPQFTAKTIVMSTRIGKLASDDDFYITDQGLFVLETTINNFNDDLYKASNPHQLFTWLRAAHASWTATNGSNWTSTFALHNSGTYNNQYLVVDAKCFRRGEAPHDGFLWIIEQYPGITRARDMTDVLNRKGFFPSFNRPWFVDLYNLAGFPQRIKEWGADGNYWTYNTSARFYLFEREGPRLKSFEQFKSFMRYNNWRRDLYSNGDPGQMILSRYDQRENRSVHLRARLFGGLDSKCLRLTEAATQLRFHAFASPAWDEENRIPVFSFPENLGKEYHLGLPTTWNFSWIQFESWQPHKCAKFPNKKACVGDDLCGWCGHAGQCLPGDEDGPFLGLVCKSGWAAKNTREWVTPVAIVVPIVVVIIVALVVFFVWRRKKQQRQQAL
jgi:hypothetical protein